MGLALLPACLWPALSFGQIPIIGIITGAVKEVIVAADLKIEQDQTQTIEAQATEREADNEMQASELSGIAGWVQDQEALFAAYYQELREVKAVLTDYEAVKQMIAREGQVLSGVSQASAALSADKHFSAAEVATMAGTLAGIAKASADNLGRLTLAVQALLTQMDDAGRLEIIDNTGSEIDWNYRDLSEFTQKSYLLSVQRSRDADDVAVTRALYGIQ